QAAKFEYEERKREALEKLGDTQDGAAAVAAIAAEFNRLWVAPLDALDKEVEKKKVDADKAQEALAMFVKKETSLPSEVAADASQNGASRPDGAKEQEAGLQKVES